jgi:3-deoxy-D-manno-octulosonic-acid transferase
MPYLLNTIYLIALVLFSPYLLYKALTTGKYRRGLFRKFTGRVPTRTNHAPCAWFHGVSVGEIHLLRQVVARFRRRHPDWDCVISTTTDTGFDEAHKSFPDLHVVAWPFDFSWAVRRALRRLNPSLILLAEGELWPNFLLAARARGVPVAVINGRMSPRSGRRYHRLRLLARPLLRCIDLFAVQTPDHAAGFRAAGAAADRVHVTGSVKYDGVLTDRHNPRTAELRRLLDVRPGELIWIAGSTQAPEEQIALDVYRRLKAAHPAVRLFLVPRQKDRFDEVAALLQRSQLRFIRRSALPSPTPDPAAVVLVDTIGELGPLWGLADVAFVGGSLDGHRGGQNMIEPAAYGAAVLFGPHVWNFRDTAARLVAAGAAVQVADAAGLERTVHDLTGDAAQREALGTAAREFVAGQQGATERTMVLLDRLLAARRNVARAA